MPLAKFIWRLENYRCRRALAWRGYLNFLEKRPVDAIPVDYADLWYLYRLVRKRRPRVILEFGSGCSTIILAQALFDNTTEKFSKAYFEHANIVEQRNIIDQHGVCYSLDVSQQWANLTQLMIPERLKRFCKVIHAPVMQLSHNGILVFRHQNVPQVPIDMLYYDSPPLTPDVSVAVDPLDLEEFFNPGFVMCIDGRKKNVEYLRSHLRRRYRFSSSRIRNSAIFYLTG